VIDVDALSCLDGLLWLRDGASVARRLAANQSTVSRNAKRALALFGVEARKHGGEWHLSGDRKILNMERKVHQQHRWMGLRPLRLEAQYWSGPILCDPAPEGWIAGNFDFLNVQRPLELLREGIVDAWLGCYPDVPSDDDPDLAWIRLNRIPTFLTVADGHPLLSLGDAVALEDVRGYPSLALADGAFPAVQNVLACLGLWSSPARAGRYRYDLWNGLAECELVVGFATVFTIGLFPVKQNRLPIEIPLEVGDSLIVRREFLGHPRLDALHGVLLGRLQPWIRRHPEIRLCT
jgi:hypothetical protein